MKACYFLLIFFSFNSFAVVILNCEIDNIPSLEYIDKTKPNNLKAICSDFKKQTKSCCLNPNQCSRSVTKSLLKGIQEIGPSLISDFYGMKGSLSQDSFEACRYKNISNLSPTLLGGLQEIQIGSCKDSIEECQESCSSEYKGFLIDTITSLTATAIISNDRRPRRNLEINLSNNNTIKLKDLKTIQLNNVNDLSALEQMNLESLKGILFEILNHEKCKNKDITQKIKHNYQTLSEKSFDSNSGIHDFVKCEDVKTPKSSSDPKDMGEYPLQICKKVINGLRNGTFTPPSSLRQQSSPSTSPGQSLMTGFDDNSNSATSGNEGDLNPGSEPLDEISLPDFSSPKDPSKGFGGLNAGQGGSPGGGAGGGGGSPGGKPGGRPDSSLFTGFDDSGYENWQMGSSSMGYPSGGYDDFANNSFMRPIMNNRKLASASSSPVNINKYFPHTSSNEKSIFQIMSHRIQKFCSSKIRTNCL